MTVTDFGFVIAGGGGDLSVWASPDGTTWSYESLGRAMWVGDVSAQGRTVLVIGRSDCPTSTKQARVWIDTAIPTNTTKSEMDWSIPKGICVLGCVLGRSANSCL